MADFNISYPKTKKWEGNEVYAWIANDDGGETYAGLARRYNPAFGGWGFIDQQKKKYKNGRIPNGTKFPELSPMVKDFYYKQYWLLQAKADKIKSQPLADLVFDMVVNHGKGEQVVNQGIRNAGGSIKVTNSITGDTLNFLNSIPEKVYPFIWKSRESYIRGLKDFQHFGTGWLNRLNSFPKSIGATLGAGAPAKEPVNDQVKKKS